MRGQKRVLNKWIILDLLMMKTCHYCMIKILIMMITIHQTLGD